MSDITDAGVACLAQLASLEELELQFAWQFGDAGIAALARLTALSRLDLIYRRALLRLELFGPAKSVFRFSACPPACCACLPAHLSACSCSQPDRPQQNLRHRRCTRGEGGRGEGQARRSWLARGAQPRPPGCRPVRPQACALLFCSPLQLEDHG